MSRCAGLSALATVLGLALLPTQSMGQTFLGAGSHPCEEWDQERRANSALGLGYELWLSGYISGANAAEVIRLNEKDFIQGTNLHEIID
jgi:hypothetical protein